MQPIDELLARIKWDKTFGEAEFVLGYYDRVTDTIERVPLSDVEQREGELHLEGPDGPIYVPLHRIRRVWRDDALIWTRDPEG